MAIVLPNNDILGKGLKFPFTIGKKSTGKSGVALQSGREKVYESIRIILETNIGERFMRRLFGGRVQELTFEPQDEDTEALIKHFVIDAIGRWEKRVLLLDVIVDMEQRTGRVNIKCIVYFIQTQEVGNLVYPFYLDEFRRLRGVR